MAQRSLDGLTIAVLATDGFEQAELTEPRKALDTAGAATEVVSPKQGKVRGWKSKEWGDEVRSIKPSTTPIPRITARCCYPAGSSMRMRCACSPRPWPS